MQAPSTPDTQGLAPLNADRDVTVPQTSIFSDLDARDSTVYSSSDMAGPGFVVVPN